jgi:ribonucleotide monophosphatase NagD (HAD superfamily)
VVAAMITVAIDYDGTWTADPEAFAAFANLLRKRGHRVIIVTARATNYAEVVKAVGKSVDRVIGTSGAAKRSYCEACGESVSIWIDDMPEMIVASVLIGSGP